MEKNEKILVLFFIRTKAAKGVSVSQDKNPHSKIVKPALFCSEISLLQQSILLASYILFSACLNFLNNG